MEPTLATDLTFRGSITPAAQSKSLRFFNHLEIVEPDIDNPLVNIIGSSEVRIDNGLFECTISSSIANNSGDTGIYKLRGTVNSVIRNILDVINFTTGQTLDLEIDAVFSDDKQIHSFETERIIISPMVEYFQINNRIGWSLRILGIKNGLHLRHALSDFRRAMKYQDEVAMFCFRAIESVRQHFAEGAPQGTKNIKDYSWLETKSNLCITQAFLNQFYGSAVAQRHGELQSLRGFEVGAILEATWLVMKRFADFLESGNCDNCELLDLTPRDYDQP